MPYDYYDPAEHPVECPNPGSCDCPNYPDQMPGPGGKIVRGDDLTYIIEEVYARVMSAVNKMQPVQDKRPVIQNTGKLVWIVDRFVDIDFDQLKRIPMLADGDQLMVIHDETHGDETSIYRIYNTESVPNIRYLGYGEPNLYPSIPAVQQYVNITLAGHEQETANTIQELRDSIKETSDMVKTISDQITTMQEQIDQIKTVSTTNTSNIAAQENTTTTLTADVTALKSDMEGVQTKSSSNMNNIANLRSQMTTVATDLAELTQRVGALESK